LSYFKLQASTKPQGISIRALTSNIATSANDACSIAFDVENRIDKIYDVLIANAQDGIWFLCIDAISPRRQGFEFQS
tara:strand:- start:32963 stop:33193 length:231 start_codon:yes stop_codon:yes gene_type:complete